MHHTGQIICVDADNHLRERYQTALGTLPGGVCFPGLGTAFASEDGSGPTVHPGSTLQTWLPV